MSPQKTLTFHATGGDLAISAIQDWHITVSDDAVASERYAAEEFQNWFNQATGFTLRLVTAQDNANADSGQIVISYHSSRQNPLALAGGCRRALRLIVKKDLIFRQKCGIILVSSWQTFTALSQGNVSAYPL